MTTAARTRETRAIHAGVHRGMGHTVSAHRAGRMALAALLVVAGVVEWSVAAAHANVPSNRSGLIAFQRNGDASGEVWVLNPNAPEPEGAAVKVSSDGVPEARPAYGPTSDNETWPLAFQRFAGGDWDIWSAIGRGNASNGEPAPFGTATALVSGPGDQESPAYSRIAAGVAPLLAYTSTQTGARELWLRDAAGDLKQLTGDGAGYANPDFAGRYRLVDADGDGGFDTPRIGWSSNAWSQAPAAFGRWTSTSASTRARTSPRAGCDLSPPAPETSSTPRGRRPTTSTSARRRRR
jgi:hypothetical protein